MKRSFALLLIASTSLYAIRGNTYELETHEKLSEAATKNSIINLNPNVLHDFGLPKSIEDNANQFPNSDGKPRNISNLITDGARFEDGKYPLSIRPLFHFFDPLHDEGLLFFTSPTWALEDKGKIHFLQNYSYSDARNHLYTALTLSDDKERKKYFGKTFESLGRIIHHIQDMAQPQHVRLDTHLNLNFTDEELPIERRSRYELYTEDKASGRKAGGLPDGTYPSVNSKGDLFFLATPRSFWHTETKNPKEGKGIAEFANTNFLSARTNFRGAVSGGQIVAQPNVRYPLPAWNGKTYTEPLQTLLQQDGTCPSPEPVCQMQGDMVFFATNVHDNYRGTTEENPRASTLSIFDQDLEKYGKKVTYPNLDKCTDPNNPDTCETYETDRVFSLNRFNFDAAHQFLIPRAVAYSAGLIDYLFRRELAVEIQLICIGSRV